MTRNEAVRLGEEDGVAEVLNVLSEQGREVVIATLRPGHDAWDEQAIGNACHTFRGVPEEHRAAYYEGYERAARSKAEEIRDE